MLVFARQQPGRERVVGHEADAELDAAGQKVALGGALEQRVLVLESGDRPRPGGLLELLDGEVRDADRTHLARIHELGHGGGGLGDRRHLVGPVVVEQVDVVGLKPLERAVERTADVARLPSRRHVVAHVAAELRRQHHLVAATAQELAEHSLAPAPAAVDVGRVEERDAGGDRRIDDGARAVEVEPAAEVVAAEPHPRDPQRPQRHAFHARECIPRPGDRRAAGASGNSDCPPSGIVAVQHLWAHDGGDDRSG